MKLTKGALAKKLVHDAPVYFKPSPRKRKKGWWGLVAAAMSGLSVITVVILFYLSLCANIVQEQYKVDRLESILPQLQEENASLLITVRHLSELSRIDRIARVDLKMGLPGERFMIVSPGIERVADVERKVASLLQVSESKSSLANDFASERAESAEGELLNEKGVTTGARFP